MQKISDSEWLVMEVLWEKSPCVLKDIVDALQLKTQWSRNTVHTYLTRMEKKKLVSIDKKHEPHLYSFYVSKEECLKQERENLLNKVYQGAVGDLVAAFLKDSQITPEEKERLNKILDEMEV